MLRSLPSIGLRYAAQDRSARALAQWWQSQPACAQLLHPAFAGAPGHEHWQDVCGESGLSAGLFSVLLHERYTQDQVDAFCNDLKLFRLGYSWGGPVSLVVPYALQTMRSAWPVHLARGTLVRFSTGLESPEALIQDLAQSLQQNLPA